VPTTQDATASQQLKSGRASPCRGLLSVVVRPQPLSVGVGIVVAATFIILETVLVYWLQHTGTDHSFRALFLLGVVVVSAACGFRLAVATSLVSALLYVYFHLDPGNSIDANDFVALFVFLPIALSANIIGRQARLRANESEERRRQADAAASLARTLAQQQAALRRVATLVARGVAPAEVYPAAAIELSRALGVDNVALLQYGPDGATVVVDSRDEHGKTILPKGERLSLEGDNIAALVQRHGQAARMDHYVAATGPMAERVRSLRLQTAAGAPILVDDHIWGALIAGSARAGPLPPGTELRIRDFADLVATAISNADTRAELNASRARIAAAADQARQRFERDLHDGAQQHVVSLGLQLRAVEAAVPPDLHELRQQISVVVDGLGAVAAELRELSRGMHPANLSKGGLGPAIKALARRSAIPVALDLGVTVRMPEQVEVAAYYVVAEALTNAAKYARASEVTVRANVADGNLHLTIRDDGVGGAAVGTGSGLIGLKDRVEVLDGQFDVISPYGLGTTLVAIIPLESAAQDDPATTASSPGADVADDDDRDGEWLWA
jgi:signal transduction histidine kinase